MKQQVNFRASELTSRQLGELVSLTGMNQTEVIAIAIDRMYQEETKETDAMNTKTAKRTITITRRSHLGWNYNEGWERDRDGKDVLPVPTKPHHTGTYRTVSDAIDNDRGFQLCKSGGTYYTSRWFARDGGRWVPINGEDLYMLDAFEEIEVDVLR